MSEVSSFLAGLSAGKRWGLALGALLVVAVVSLLGWWAFRTQYGVLFSDMSEQDLAAVVQELDKLKVPYEVGGNGHAVLVPEANVHKTRMALMARDLPLHGAVGFELFNNADFGVSDFVQKVNYQRALQGELTRTILSIEQVQSVRVHLALPEQTLFRKEDDRAKASVTIVTKPGQTLQMPQVMGIQRLVAASVPDVRADDVTVIDQHGVTLSRSTSGEEAGAAGSASIDSKGELEAHLGRKATQVLEQVFGAGGALVTVDALFNTQQVKVTTEEVLPAIGRAKNLPPAGVIVRERTVTRDAAAEGAAKGGAGATSQDVDYQTGKRVEQVVSPAGGLARLNVAVVVKQPLEELQMARVRELVAAAVGLQPGRGDVLAVYSMAKPAEVSGQAVDGPLPALAASTAGPSPSGRTSPVVVFAALTLAAAMLALLFVAVSRRRAPVVSGGAGVPPRLTEAQRQALLSSVQGWLVAPEGHRER